MDATTNPVGEAPDLPAAIAEATEILGCFSVPLYINLRERPALFGTGFFVNSDGHSFLVSAAHVFDFVDNDPVFFYSSPGATQFLLGKLLRTKKKKSRENDHIDIGVLKLSPGSGPPYKDVNKYAMDISYLKPCRTPRSGKHYITIGFPATKSDVNAAQRSVTAAPYGYRSDSADESMYSSLGLNEATHIVLPLDLKHGFDSKGKHAHFPKPKGMSGAPIVELYDAIGNNDSHVFPIVGVGIEYRKAQRSLIGTDISFAIDMIQDAA